MIKTVSVFKTSFFYLLSLLYQFAAMPRRVSRTKQYLEFHNITGLFEVSVFAQHFVAFFLLASVFSLVA